jgi:hypothetical protein
LSDRRKVEREYLKLSSNFPGPIKEYVGGGSGNDDEAGINAYSLIILI